MTVVVHPHNEQEEKVLLAFLNSLNYEYSSEQPEVELTAQQQQEILAREQKLKDGTTTTRSWDDIKKDFDNVYH
ncbi:addiction module protein [Mucilaginibacter sp. RS28]|uniref:Addiction module protein n=1 Tax=Mucilaginibacter straminoryzae TaxID=2932774 RepID=A0A9X1X321_9SPHI|nr:addiction module protein [Mucilaginibacter straminoryzae]MCJ8210292.1 addiction module protein [Mucilaginibacter straminoryzae]